MSILVWLIIGLVAGVTVNRIVWRSSEALVLDVLLSILGSVVGGFLFMLVGPKHVGWVEIIEIVVSGTTAVVFMFGYHAILDRSHQFDAQR